MVKVEFGGPFLLLLLDAGLTEDDARGSLRRNPTEPTKEDGDSDTVRTVVDDTVEKAEA